MPGTAAPSGLASVAMDDVALSSFQQQRLHAMQAATSATTAPAAPVVPRLHQASRAGDAKAPTSRPAADKPAVKTEPGASKADTFSSAFRSAATQAVRGGAPANEPARRPWTPPQVLIPRATGRPSGSSSAIPLQREAAAADATAWQGDDDVGMTAIALSADMAIHHRASSDGDPTPQKHRDLEIGFLHAASQEAATGRSETSNTFTAWAKSSGLMFWQLPVPAPLPASGTLGSTPAKTGYSQPASPTLAAGGTPTGVTPLNKLDDASVGGEFPSAPLGDTAAAHSPHPLASVAPGRIGKLVVRRSGRTTLLLDTAAVVGGPGHAPPLTYDVIMSDAGGICQTLVAVMPAPRNTSTFQNSLDPHSDARPLVGYELGPVGSKGVCIPVFPNEGDPRTVAY